MSARCIFCSGCYNVATLFWTFEYPVSSVTGKDSAQWKWEELENPLLKLPDVCQQN